VSPVLFAYIKKVGAGISGGAKLTAHHRVVSGLRMSGIPPCPFMPSTGKNSLVLTRVNKLLFTDSHTWIHVKQNIPI